MLSLKVGSTSFFYGCNKREERGPGHPLEIEMCMGKNQNPPPPPKIEMYERKNPDVLSRSCFPLEKSLATPL